jgi:precorrin-6x reductase
MILLAGGTSEAIEIARALDRAKSLYVMTVATEYGYGETVKKVAGKVLKGPFNRQDFEKLINDYSVETVLDATHVYAGELRLELAGAAHSAGIRLVRFERPAGSVESNPAIECFDDPAALGAWARDKDFKRIFVSTGIKGLQALARHLDPDRIYVRLLPANESITAALNAGLKQSHIIAMEGPFSRDLNEALFRHLQIDLLVTKDSGEAGGFSAKIEAAVKIGFRVAVLKRPAPAKGEVFHNISSLLQSLGIAVEEETGWHVILLGHGSRLETANQGLKLVAEELGRRGQFIGVTPAFLQHAAPSLEEVFQKLAKSGSSRIVIMPLFLFEGVHITSDIPAEIDKIRVKYPHLQVVQSSFIGPDPLLADICLRRISDAIMKY